MTTTPKKKVNSNAQIKAASGSASGTLLQTRAWNADPGEAAKINRPLGDAGNWQQC